MSTLTNSYSATFFDGRSASSQTVEVAFIDEGIDFTAAGGESHLWPYRRVRVERLDGVVRLTNKKLPDALLILPDAAHAGLVTKAPMLAVKQQQQRHFTQLIIGLTLAAAAVAIFVFVVMPRAATSLARNTPIDLEEQIGENLASQFQAIFRPCRNEITEQMLAPIVDEFAIAGEVGIDVTLRFVRTDMPNAFALPGGQMMATRGLLITLESDQEAFWAVIAHEMAHVKNRDSMVALYRNLGFSTLLEIVTGGSGVAQQAILLGGQVSAMNYSRQQETDADEKAYDIMEALGLNPAALGRGLHALAHEADNPEDNDAFDVTLVGDIPEWLESHPDTNGRIRRAQMRQSLTSETLPLSDEDWQQVVTSCNLHQDG